MQKLMFLSNEKERELDSKKKKEGNRADKQYFISTEAANRLKRQTFFVQAIDYTSTNRMLQSAALLTEQNNMLVHGMVLLHNTDAVSGSSSKRLFRDMYSFDLTHQIMMVPNRDALLGPTRRKQRRLQRFSMNMAALAAVSTGGPASARDNSSGGGGQPQRRHRLSDQRVATLSSAATQYYSDLYFTAGAAETLSSPLKTIQASARAVEVFQQLNTQYLGMQELLRVAQLKDQWLRHGPTMYNPTQQEQTAKQLLRDKLMSVSAEAYPLTGAQTWAINLTGVAIVAGLLAFPPFAAAIFGASNIPFLTSTGFASSTIAIQQMGTTLGTLSTSGYALYTGCWYVMKGGVDWYNTGEWRYFTAGALKGATNVISVMAFGHLMFDTSKMNLLQSVPYAMWNCFVQFSVSPISGQLIGEPFMRFLSFQSEGDLLVQNARLAAEARQRMDEALQLEKELQEYNATMERVNIELRGASWPRYIWKRFTPEAKIQCKNLYRYVKKNYKSIGMSIFSVAAQAVAMNTVERYYERFGLPGEGAGMFTGVSKTYTKSIITSFESVTGSGPLGEENIAQYMTILELIIRAIGSTLADQLDVMSVPRLVASAVWTSYIVPYLIRGAAEFSMLVSSVFSRSVVFIMTNKTIGGNIKLVRSFQRHMRRNQNCYLLLAQIMQGFTNMVMQTHLSNYIHRAVPAGVFSSNKAFGEYMELMKKGVLDNYDYIATSKTEFLVGGDKLYTLLSDSSQAKLSAEEDSDGLTYTATHEVSVETFTTEKGETIDYLAYRDLQKPVADTPAQPLDPNKFPDRGVYVKRVDSDGKDVFIPVNLEAAQYNMMHHGKNAVDSYYAKITTSSTQQQDEPPARYTDGMQRAFFRDVSARMNAAFKAATPSIVYDTFFTTVSSSTSGKLTVDGGSSSSLFLIWMTNAVERGEYEKVLEALTVQKQLIRLQYDMAEINELLTRLHTADMYGNLQARAIQAAHGRFNQALNDFVKDTAVPGAPGESWSTEEYKEQLLTRVFLSNPMIPFSDVEHAREILDTPGMLVDVKNPQIVELLDEFQSDFAESRQLAESIMSESVRIAEYVSVDQGSETFHADSEAMFLDLHSKFASGDVDSALEVYKDVAYNEQRQRIYFTKARLQETVPFLDEHINLHASSEWTQTHFSGFSPLNNFMRNPGIATDESQSLFQTHPLLQDASAADTAIGPSQGEGDNFWQQQQQQRQLQIERVEAQLAKLLRGKAVYISSAGGGEGVSFSTRDVNSLIMEGRYADAEILLGQIHNDIRKLEDTDREQILKAAIKQVEKLKEAPSVHLLLGYEPLADQTEQIDISDVGEVLGEYETTTIGGDESQTEQIDVGPGEVLVEYDSVVLEEIDNTKRRLTADEAALYDRMTILEEKIGLLDSVVSQMSPPSKYVKSYDMILYHQRSINDNLASYRSEIVEFKDQYFFHDASDDGVMKMRAGYMKDRIAQLESRVHANITDHLKSLIELQRGSDNVTYFSDFQDDDMIMYIKSMNMKDVGELNELIESREFLATMAESIYASSGERNTAGGQGIAAEWYAETKSELQKLKSQLNRLETFFERPQFERGNQDYRFDLNVFDEYLKLRSNVAEQVYLFKDKLFLDTHSFVDDLNVDLLQPGSGDVSGGAAGSVEKAKTYFKTIEQVKRLPHTQQVNRVLHSIATFVDATISTKIYGQQGGVAGRLDRLTPEDYQTVTTFMKTLLVGEQLGYLSSSSGGGGVRFGSQANFNWKEETQDVINMLSRSKVEHYTTADIMEKISSMQQTMSSAMFDFIYDSTTDGEGGFGAVKWKNVDYTFRLTVKDRSRFYKATDVPVSANDEHLLAVVEDFVAELGLLTPGKDTPAADFSDNFLSLVRGSKMLALQAVKPNTSNDVLTFGLYSEMRKYLHKSADAADASGNTKVARAIREELLPNMTPIFESKSPLIERFDLKGAFKACSDVERILAGGAGDIIDIVGIGSGFRIHDTTTDADAAAAPEFTKDPPPLFVPEKEMQSTSSESDIRDSTGGSSIYDMAIRMYEKTLADENSSEQSKRDAAMMLDLTRQRHPRFTAHNDILDDEEKHAQQTGGAEKELRKTTEPSRAPSTDKSTLDGMHAEKVKAVSRNASAKLAQTLDHAIVGASVLDEATFVNGKYIFRARTTEHEKRNLKTLGHERKAYADHQRKVNAVLDSKTKSTAPATLAAAASAAEAGGKSDAKNQPFMTVQQAESYKLLVQREPEMWTFYKGTGMSDDASKAKALQRYNIALRNGDIAMANAQLCYMAGLNTHKEIQQYIQSNENKFKYKPTSSVDGQQQQQQQQQQQLQQQRNMTVEEFLNSPEAGETIITEKIIPTYEQHRSAHDWVRENVAKILQGNLVNFAPCLQVDQQQIAYGKGDVFIYDRNPVDGSYGALNKDLTQKCLINPLAVYVAGFGTQYMNTLGGITFQEQVTAASAGMFTGLNPLLSQAVAGAVDTYNVHTVLPAAEKMIAEELEQTVEDVVQKNYAGISSAYLYKFLALLSTASNKEKHIREGDMSELETHQYAGSKIHLAEFIFNAVYAATRDMTSDEDRNQYLNGHIDSYQFFVERLYDFNVLAEELDQNRSVDAVVTSTLTALRKVGFTANDVFKLDVFGGADGYIAKSTDELARWALWQERKDNDEKWAQLKQAVIETFTGPDEPDKEDPTEAQEGVTGKNDKRKKSSATPFPADRMPLWRSAVLGAYSIVVASDGIQFIGEQALNSNIGKHMIADMLFGTGNSSTLRRHVTDWVAHESAWQQGGVAGELEKVLKEGKWYKPDSEKTWTHWGAEKLFSGMFTTLKTAGNNLALSAGSHDFFRA